MRRFDELNNFGKLVIGASGWHFIFVGAMAYRLHPVIGAALMVLGLVVLIVFGAQAWRADCSGRDETPDFVINQEDWIHTLPFEDRNELAFEVPPGVVLEVSTLTLGVPLYVGRREGGMPVWSNLESDIEHFLNESVDSEVNP